MKFNEWKNFTSLLWYTIVTTTQVAPLLLLCVKCFQDLYSPGAVGCDCVENISVFGRLHVQTYPQCFMFCGLSMRMASFILRSLSGQLLDTVILWNSDCFGLFGVGCSTTCGEQNNKFVMLKLTKSFGQRVGTLQWCDWFMLLVHLEQMESSGRSSPFPALCLPAPTLLYSQWTVWPWQLAEVGWWWSLPASPN